MDDSDQARTVYVGNLASGTAEGHLYELFLQAGPLEYVKIPIDRASKVAKNFAFICYRHECSVPYAVHLLNDVNLHGKQIRVQARDTKTALKDTSEVGIHSLDPDFLTQNMSKTLNQPLMSHNPPLISHNPYMNPYQQNQNNGRLYVNSYSNSNNYQYNHKPLMIDTYSMNMQNMQGNYYQRNYDSERYQHHNSSHNQNYRDRYSSNRHQDSSSYRSSEYRNSNNINHRNRPYDKYNDGDRSRY